MADFHKGKRTFVQGEEAAQIFFAGEEAEFVFGRGTQIFPNAPFPLYGRTGVEMILDDDGYWFEFGFRIDAELSGNAGAGWTDARNYLLLEVQQSLDLETWNMGKFGPSPVDSVIDRGDGTWEYWGRCFVPNYWISVMVDLTATSNRYGKAITGISVLGVDLSLDFPYDPITDAATLEADLDAAGFPGATVTVTSASLSAIAKNHRVGGVTPINLFGSGSTVTGAEYVVPGTGWVTLTLANASYSLPSEMGLLQGHLRDAGATGAVVNLYGDEWEIVLPDVAATGQTRKFVVTIDPGDPYPAWNVFGTYVGLAPADLVNGVSVNVRTPTGTPLEEAGRQFARLKISAGGRYSAYV